MLLDKGGCDFVNVRESRIWWTIFLPSTLRKLQQARRLIDENGLDIRLRS